MSVATETDPLQWRDDTAANTKFQTVTVAHDEVTGIDYTDVDYHEGGHVLFVSFASEETGTVIMDRSPFSSLGDAKRAARLLQRAHRATLAAVEQAARVGARPISIGSPGEFGYTSAPATQVHHSHRQSQFGFSANARINGK